MTTAGGGWTVFQRRLDGSVDFYRGWNDYVHGFGNTSGEFWLGLDNIQQLTSSGKYRLRIDMEDKKGTWKYATYEDFEIGVASKKYRLNFNSFNGNAGNSLGYHLGKPFTTYDNDNDNNGLNCAQSHHGAWWYKGCMRSNLNGKYNRNSIQGIVWKNWHGMKYSLKSAEMKIRKI